MTDNVILSPSSYEEDDKFFDDQVLDEVLKYFSEDCPNFEDSSKVMEMPSFEIDALIEELSVRDVAEQNQTQPLGSYVPANSGRLVNSNPRPQVPNRRKGTSWTLKEHELFLIGLEKYEKGNWKFISRYAVKTRSQVQVASHAQKYFARHDPMKRGEKNTRGSIFDVTTVRDSTRYEFEASLANQNYDQKLLNSQMVQDSPILTTKISLLSSMYWFRSRGLDV